MDDNKLTNIESASEIFDSQAKSLEYFLQDLGLPSDNIIANNQNRQHIAKNLPDFIKTLPDEIKQDGRYLSKFVVGSGFGLFDYALNSIWNEVVLALRKKAIAYGLNIFFDASVGGKARDLYNTEDDLAGLKDKILLDTCKKLELISLTTYKKLAHILDMRNDIGISHPTNNTINAFELMGWFQSCIEDVLQNQPSESAIQVKSFIDNLKNREDLIDDETLMKINTQLGTLNSLHCSRILRTIFGIYVTNETNQILRKNISLILPKIWELSVDELKYKLGIILEGYNNNLHTSKYNFGIEFFEIVDGNRYRTSSEKLINLDYLSNELKDAHFGWDNFYKEAPIIQNIMSYFKDSTDIPREIVQSLIHNILLCRIGNGVSYKNGVSPAGKPLYDDFFKLLKDEFIPILIIEISKYDIQQRINKAICKQHLVEILQIISGNIINERYKECIDFLILELPNKKDVIFSNEFKNLSSSFIRLE